MDLRIAPFLNKNVNKINFKNISNPIGFKGLEKDTFEKSKQPDIDYSAGVEEIFNLDDEIENMNLKLTQIKKAQSNLRPVTQSRQDEYSKMLKEEFELKEQIKEAQKRRSAIIAKYNKNVAFLLDESLTWPRRREELKSHPEIINIKDIEKVQNDTCFRKIFYQSPYLLTLKTNIGKFLDTDLEINRKNLEVLDNENLLSFAQFQDKFGFSERELNRYIKMGYFTPIELQNLKTGENERVNIIDPSNYESIKTGVERHNAVQSIKPEESKFISTPYHSCAYLSRLGFGSVNELENGVMFQTLDGKTIKVDTPQGIKSVVVIDTSSKRMEGELKFRRNENKQITDPDGIMQLAKIDVTDYEEALLNGEIEIVPEYIFESDKDALYFDLSNKKNKEFIKKKQFEYQVYLEDNKREKLKARSLLGHIKWKLCPETKKVLAGILYSKPEFQDAFEKSKEIKDFKRRQLNNEVEPDEAEPYLTFEERKKLETLYKIMWSKAGYSEWNNAGKIAKRAFMQYKTNGIEAVSDPKIKEAIEEWLEENEPAG